MTQITLFLLVGCVLAARYLLSFYTETGVCHLQLLMSTFERLDSGELWVRGEELSNTGFFLGGPLYAWLQLPARLLDNPVTGLCLNAFALELLCIGVWFFWPTEQRAPDHDLSAPDTLGDDRLGLRADQRRLGALYLALCPETKVEMVQNDTVMAVLLIPLFVTYVWALGHKSWRAMAVPGVLVGAAVCVHQSASLVLPVLLLGLALRPRDRFWRRALAGLAGLSAVILLIAIPSLVGNLWPLALEPDVVNPMAQDAGSLKINGQYVGLRLAALVGSPWATMGMILVAAAWIGRRHPPRAHRFALIWLLVTTLLYTVFLSIRTELLNEPTAMLLWRANRFAPLNPGRAALAGVAGWWIYRLAGRLLRGDRLPHLGLSPIIAVASLAAVGLLGVKTRAAMATFHVERQTFEAATCSPSFFGGQRLPACLLHRVYGSMVRDPLVYDAQPTDDYYATYRSDVACLTRWRGGPVSEDVRRRFPETSTIVVPRFPQVDVTALLGARRHGPAVVLPNALLLKDQKNAMGQGPPDRRLLTLDRWSQGKNRRWLLVVTSANADPAPRLELDTPSGPRTVAPTDRCASLDPDQEGRRWELFDLHKLPQQTRTVSLVRTRDVSSLADVTAIVLPPGGVDDI